MQVNELFAIYSISMAILTICNINKICGSVLKFIARDLIKKTSGSVEKKTVDDFSVVVFEHS